MKKLFIILAVVICMGFSSAHAGEVEERLTSIKVFSPVYEGLKMGFGYGMLLSPFWATYILYKAYKAKRRV